MPILLPPNLKCVIVSGKLMSGKSTLSDYICWQSAFEKHTLADELKDDICRLCGVTRAYMEEHKDLFRPILQWYGTDFHRARDENYWVQRLKGRIEVRSPAAVVVDDARFTNEVYGFDECAPYKVRLQISLEEQVRRYIAKFKREPDMSIFYHSSETALDEMPDEAWDVVVGVDGLTTLQVRDCVFAAAAYDGFDMFPRKALDSVPSFGYTN
jgi:hypothetical protein